MVGPEAFTEVRYLPHHKQLRALDLHSRSSRRSSGAQFGRDSGGLIRTYRTEDAETIVVALGSVNGTIQEVVDEMRARRLAIGSVSICSFRPFPLAALREALRHAKRVVVLEKCLAVGLGGIVSDGVRKSLSGIELNGYTVIAGLGGRAITRASLRELFEDAERDELEQVTFLDLNADVVEPRARAREPRAAHRPHGRGDPAAHRHRRVAHRLSRRGPSWKTRLIKFYQTGTFTVGNRLLAEDQRSVQADMHRTNSLNSGHRACQGCGEALGARYAIDAAMRATSNQLIAVNATGCLEVFSTPYPETSWQIPWIHSLFGNAAAVASGVAAAQRALGRKTCA